MPLSVILLISLLRAVYQEYQRQKTEDLENETEVLLYQPTRTAPVPAWTLRPGDLVLLSFDQVIKADVLLLHCTEQVHVQNSQLDGETMLKPKLHLGLQTPCSLEVEVGQPTPDLYSFQGSIPRQKRRLSIDNLGLRGSRVKSQGRVTAMVVYTGMQTKQMQNMLAKHELKCSRLDQMLFWLLFLLVVILTLMSFTLAMVSVLTRQNEGQGFVVYYFSWILKCSRIVPASLIITCEFIKFMQGALFGLDPFLFADCTSFQAVCSNTPVLENLGQVAYLLSDKTGTITCNAMELNSLESVPGRDSLLRSAMALCHGVILMSEGGHVEFVGSSAEEIAILNRLKQEGCLLCERTSTYFVVKQDDQRERVELIQLLPYVNQRKSMAVIVRLRDQNYVFAKGADEYFKGRLAGQQEQSFAGLLRSADKLAKRGQRTLIYCGRKVDEEEVAELRGQLADASTGEEAWSKTLQGLQGLGLVGLQDKIQEGVSETIGQIRRAGISFWMLTGDKLETAAEIARTIGMFEGVKQVQVFKSSRTLLEKSITQQVGWLVEGSTIALLSDEDLQQFVERTSASPVVAARISPSQKGRLCELVKQKGCVMAVGDGSNDVGMIREADVGVGMKGRENSEAMQCADVGVGQFRLLSELLFSHGRQIYRKNGTAVLFILHKNYIVVLPIFLFAFFSGFSGVPVFDQLNQQFYALFYTSIAVVLYAVFDRDRSRLEGLKSPEVYREGRESAYFNLRLLLLDLLFAFYSSAVILIPVLLVAQDSFSDGLFFSAEAQFSVVLVNAVLHSNLRVLLFVHNLSVGMLVLLVASCGLSMAATYALEWSGLSNFMNFAHALGLLWTRCLLSQVVALHGQVLARRLLNLM